MYENLPEEIKQNAVFCCWKLFYRKNEKKPSKMPFNPVTGEGVHSNDINTFVNYETAMNNLYKFYSKNENGSLAGGLGIGVFNEFSAIDIDHCLENGVLNPIADEIINFFNSYTEISPSGTGIRIIFKTNIKYDKNKYYILKKKINSTNMDLEIYICGSTFKFLTLTGNSFDNNFYVNQVNDFSEILEKYMKRSTPINTQPVNLSQHSFSVTTQEVLNRAKNDKKFQALYQGNWMQAGDYASQSEADGAFAAKLAFYAEKNIKVMDEIFRSSGLYRKKYDRKIGDSTYGKNVLFNAIGYVKEIYENDLVTRESELITYKNPTHTDVVEKENIKSRFTDTANADRLLQMVGQDVLYNYSNKIWTIWDGKKWNEDVKDDIKKYAEEVAELSLIEAKKNFNPIANKNALRMLNAAGKKNMLIEARHKRGAVNADFDADKFKINTQSGVYDLEDEVLLPFNRDFKMTKITQGGIKDAEPKLWKKFLSEVFEDNEEIIHYIHKAIGYSLTGSIREQVVFILFGEGNNGKSVFIDTLQTMLGDYSISVPIEILMEKKFQSNIETNIARIKGARMIHASENDKEDKINEGLIKQITGGEKIIGRFLFGRQFEYYPEYKLWLSTNYKPQINGTDLGIWRRIVVIPFNLTVAPDKVDKDLSDKLKKELPEILNWAIEGYKLYKKEGLILPEVLVEEKKKYKQEMDYISNFILDKISKSSGYKVQAASVYKEYKKWCYNLNYNPISQVAFGKEFGKHFSKKRDGSGIVYIDCRLKSEQKEYTMKEFC